MTLKYLRIAVELGFLLGIVYITFRLTIGPFMWAWRRFWKWVDKWMEGE